jgi:hypothetical protein
MRFHLDIDSVDEYDNRDANDSNQKTNQQRQGGRKKIHCDPPLRPPASP